MTTARQVVALAISLGICLGAAGLGSILNMPSLRSWYQALQKPSWTPPNWAFAPVWTILYLSMAVAAWLVWRQAGFSRATVPLTLFLIQLALNVLWSGLFFRMRLPGTAFFEVVLLWVFILSTAVAFRPISPIASWLMVPYLGWVTFAAALNGAIWRMNVSFGDRQSKLPHVFSGKRSPLPLANSSVVSRGSGAPLAASVLKSAVLRAMRILAVLHGRPGQF